MKRWLKGLGYVLGGLLVLVLIAASGVYGFSESRMRKQYTITPPPLTIPTDSGSVARGEHLARSIAGCADCHGADLAGQVVVDDPALGRIYAKNLTAGKGGVGKVLSDADFVRAIRHGVDPTGKALKVMPSSDYANLSDEDLAAIIAFVKSRPPVNKEVPAIVLGPVGRALLVGGKLPILHAERIDHAKPHIKAVTVATTAEYGGYLVTFGCKGCHSASLAGGHIADGPPDWPPAANLTPSGPTKTWSEEDFRRLLRAGKRPDGSAVNDVMPWRSIGRLTDDEIRAMYLYLRTVPAAATPGVKPAS
ncbi:MAG: cytochrome c [bacterium]